MDSRGLLIVFCVVTSLLGAPARADFVPVTNNDTIFPNRIELPNAMTYDANSRQFLRYEMPTTGTPPLARDRSNDWLFKANAVLVEAIRVFFKGLVPDQNGLEHPNPDEYSIDQFVKQLGESNFQFLMQGVGSLRLLGGPYLYNDLQGGIGIEYDFVGRPISGAPSDSPTILALRVSPLYGEIAIIRTAAGAAPVKGLPTLALLGASIGVEFSHKFGLLEAGVRGYARPLWDISNEKRNFGVSLYSALYCRLKLAELRGFRDTAKTAGLYLTPSISYFDRGAAQRRIYDTKLEGRSRDPGLLREIWQALVQLEVYY